MGQIVDKLQSCSGSVADALIGAGRKRKRRANSSGSEGEEKPTGEETQKKKRLLTTTQYIYKALFKEQQNSDITVRALDKSWNLHKVYLCQSPYFFTMFNGSWTEAKLNFVNLKMLDDRITVDSLDAVFGSLYSDEIEIDSKVVVSVLATATLFHLEGIIQRCAEVMIDTINAEMAIQYYEAGCRYGVMSVKKATFRWFQVNLLSIYNKKQNLLREISIELMSALTGSPDLYVMQTEFSLYTLLRTWMFLRLHPYYDPEDPQEQLKARQAQQRMTDTGVETNTPPFDIAQWAYFANRTEERSFLATPEGKPYVKTFQKLRTQYLTNHYMDLKIVFNDNIIPKEWLYRHIHSHWNSLLRIDHNQAEGISSHSPDNIDEAEFKRTSMRCGRLLVEPGYQKWRWTGYNFGLDLILILDSRRLNIRRHHRHEHERMLTLQTKRQFMVRVAMTSINTQRQPVYTQMTEIKTLTLEKNEEVELMFVDANLVHPLLISVNLLVVPPPNLSFKAVVPASDEYGICTATTTPISEIGANCERPLTPTSTNDSAVSVGEPSPTSTPPCEQRNCIWSSNDSSALMPPPALDCLNEHNAIEQ